MSKSYQGSYELITSSGLFLASSVLGYLIGNQKVAMGVFVVWLTSWLFHWPKPDRIPNKIFRYIDMTSNAVLSCIFIHEIWPDRRLRFCVWIVIGITAVYVLRKLYFADKLTPSEEMHTHALLVHVPWYLTFAYCHYIYHYDTVSFTMHT